MEEYYREQIIKVVSEVNNYAFLKMIYGFMIALKNKWGI